MVFQTEKDLEKAATPYFLNLGMSYALQVPLHNRMVDLAAIDNKGNLIGVEFKLKDWKRGIKQALTNSNTFDYSYVCVPGGRYLKNLIREASQHGIGVMIYDMDIEAIKIEVKARKSKYKWRPNTEYVKYYLGIKAINENQ